MFAVLLAALTTRPEAIDPYGVFERTRQYWQSQHYPPRLQYTVSVTVVENGKSKTQKYAAGYDAQADTLIVDPVSDIEKAHPFRPPGGFSFGWPFGRTHGGNPVVDYFGVPLLAPNYSFGLGITPRGAPPATPSPMEIVRQIRDELHDPMPPRNAPHPDATPTSPPQIAVVATRTRTYDIAFAGTETIDGVAAYHLNLRPLREPGRFRLRELWVDRRTFAPLKLTEHINFLMGPGTTVPWSITFVQIDGATYVASETALGPTKLNRARYSSVRIDFENIRVVDKLDEELSPYIPYDTLLIEEP